MKELKLPNELKKILKKNIEKKYCKKK